jgi:dTDP-4-dehydrorhamnose 3,5-epimerase-like enzyme
MKTIKACKVIALPKIQTISGNITSLNNGFNVPFDVKRVFYIYDIPAGSDRGAHAHKECHQLLVAISGAFEVEVFDGEVKQRFTLNQPNVGLHIPPGIWASELNFSGGGICLVLASREYEEEDYIREILDYNQWISQ